jgi:hypothetical protein
MPVIPVFQRLRQEDPQFEASLGYIGKAYLEKKRKKERKERKGKKEGKKEEKKKEIF